MIDVARRWNTLTLPSCLPLAILANIFAICDPWKYHDPMIRTSLDAYEYSDNTKMLPLTQVCHHWRQVALDTPQLWCHIRMHKKLAYNEMLLERSKDSSLYVEAFPWWIDTPRISPLFRALPRTCYLHATLPVPPQGKLSLDDLLTVSPDGAKLVAPQLVTFVECGHRNHQFSSEQPSVLSVLITPNLRHATIMPVNTTLHCLHSQPLISLTIMSMDPRQLPSTVASLGDVAALLLTTPSLETLNLSLHADPNPPPAAPARISLPRLKQLQVAGDLTVVESLIRRLDTPSSTRISGHLSAELNGNNVDVARMANVTLCMIQRVAGLSIERTGALAVDVELQLLGMYTTIRCWLTEKPTGLHRKQTSCISASDDYLDIDLGDRWDIITELLLNNPALSSIIRYVHIDSAYGSFRTSPHYILQKLITEVEEVEFRGISVLRIADILDGDNGAIPCAKLRVLRLTECSKGCGGGCDAADYDEGAENGIPMGHTGCRLCQSPAAFLAVLKHRSSAGLPIQQVVITESTNGRWLAEDALHWRDMKLFVLDVSVQIQDSPFDTSFPM